MAEWDGSGLPAIAAARLERASRSGVRTSLLSVPSHTGVVASGFQPVGEVMGCIVAHIGWAGYGGCGWGFGMPFPQGTITSSNTRAFSGFGPYVDAKRSAWRTAIHRMLEECSALGGDGVVGVRLEERDLGESNREFVALGTAIRSNGAVHAERPFSTTLSGEDLAKLTRSGYLPAAIIVSISVGIRHDDWQTVQATFLSAGNMEVPGYTDLVQTVRHDVRRELDRRVREIGASGAVLTDPIHLRIFEVEPGEGHRDHVAEAHLVASAIVGTFHSPSPTLQIFPLA